MSEMEQIRIGITAVSALMAAEVFFVLLALGKGGQSQKKVLTAYYEISGLLRERGKNSSCYQQLTGWLLKNGAVYHYGKWVEPVRFLALCMTLGLAGALACARLGAAYGAAAKGNTFLNYCGIKNDVIDFVVDSNPHKQRLYLPGSLIPIVSLEWLRERKPDYLLILPWNLTDEIVDHAKFVQEWGCKFIVCIPGVHILY